MMEVKEPNADYSGSYTYADYLKWTIDERLELIKGKIFRMSPAPATRHQKVAVHLTSKLFNFLENLPCQVFVAPFDVRFPIKSKKNEDVTTVLQPDLCVVCDPDKLDERGCIGAPDIVVEILSPSNNKKELKNKYEVYEESGVKEYWIISPQDNTFFVYLLNDAGGFVPQRILVEGDVFKSPVLTGFELNIGDIFKQI